MTQANMIRGVITALVTPMYPDGTIDFDSLSNLVRFQIKNKVDGLVVAGSTGEGSMLTIDEKIAVLRHVIKIADGETAIIMAFNDIATNFAVEFTRHLNIIEGVDYYLATTPAYVRPTQNGLYEHFKAIAAVSARPVILYNIPGRTGCDLENQTALKLADECLNIIGIKDATASIARACDLLAHKGQDFALYSGDDATASEFVLNGGDGVISVASNLVPDKFKFLINDEALSGNKLSAIEANNKLKALYQALSLESNPVALKWALSFSGIIQHASVRLPLLPLTPSAQEIMKSVLMDIK